MVSLEAMPKRSAQPDISDQSRDELSEYLDKARIGDGLRVILFCCSAGSLSGTVEVCAMQDP